GPAGHGLAGAGFADNAHLLPANGKGHPADCLHHALWRLEADTQILDDKVVGHDWDRGSSTSRSPSPSKLNARLVIRMATPGTVDSHQASVRWLRPVESIAPHSGIGGCAPRPRKPSPAAVRMMPAILS